MAGQEVMQLTTNAISLEPCSWIWGQEVMQLTINMGSRIVSSKSFARQEGMNNFQVIC